MKELTIQTSSKTYPVIVGDDCLTTLADFIQNQLQPISRIWIITDKNVAPLYLENVKNQLEPYFSNILVTVVPGGEHAKTFSVFEQCHEDGLKANINRKSLILALGGGAVGDLAGFVAATYMRGIRFIGIPTTLLAHDSAVGGKVAINHKLGKNMIGAFHQPEAVFYDTKFLHSLPEKEWRSGFAEAIKHALIQDGSFYEWMLENVTRLDNINSDKLTYIITKGISIKAAVVKQDERETGIREILNFGHTLGHRIENNLGYGKITHGEAVMIGMVFALKLSIEKCGLTFDLNRFETWVKQLGYELSITRCNIQIQKLIESIKKDKKTTGKEVTFVLLKQIGEPITMKFSEEELLHSLMNYFEQF